MIWSLLNGAKIMLEGLQESRTSLHVVPISAGPWTARMEVNQPWLNLTSSSEIAKMAYNVFDQPYDFTYVVNQSILHDHAHGVWR